MPDIRKDALSIIRAQRTSYKGKEFINVRLWVQGDKPNEYKPTKQGVTLRPERLDELIRALQALRTDAEPQSDAIAV